MRMCHVRPVWHINFKSHHCRPERAERPAECLGLACPYVRGVGQGGK